MSLRMKSTLSLTTVVDWAARKKMFPCASSVSGKVPYFQIDPRMRWTANMLSFGRMPRCSPSGFQRLTCVGSGKLPQLINPWQRRDGLPCGWFRMKGQEAAAVGSRLHNLQEVLHGHQWMGGQAGWERAKDMTHCLYTGRVGTNLFIAVEKLSCVSLQRHDDQ